MSKTTKPKRRSEAARPEPAKPTPGPYHIRDSEGSGSRLTGIFGISVAWFPTAQTAGNDGSYSIEYPEARANAQAFIDGQESLIKIDKIRQVLRTFEFTQNAVVAIAAIVGEKARV